jgi:hypothetical protein
MKVDYASNLALFLLERTGSVLGTWSGRLSASDQRSLYGRHIGKGTIIIDGASETVCNRVKVCFGHDYDDRNMLRWKDLLSSNPTQRA